MIDRAFILRGLEVADLDAVKITLFHHTRDATLKQLPLAAKMSDEQKTDLRIKAADWLLENASDSRVEQPSPDAMREMMEMGTGSPIGDKEYNARAPIAGFEDYPYFAQWQDEAPEIPEDFKVAIIGSGFAGVGMGKQFDILGIDYVILERRPEPGGVWSINTYPDVRVDTMSVTYELAFERKFHWKEYFGRGSTVRKHLDDVSRSHGMHAKTLFEHDVKEARWDPAASLWRLTVASPEGEKVISVNAVVSCSGLFATPKIIEFPGKESFEGEIVHTAEWPADLQFKGRKLATIGNGSTGVQILGALAREAEHVSVFQRTPQWITPRAGYGRPIEEEHLWLIENFPGYRNWWRFTATVPLFDTHKLMLPDPEWQAQGGVVNEGNDAMREVLKNYIADQVNGDEELIAQLTPDYAPLSRRPVVDNGWYKALTRDNVDLVSKPIKRLVANGIETEDGEIHECDLIVTATGYAVEKYLWPTRYKGDHGQDLHDEWDSKDGARAYIGLMHPGFPNFFSIYGPNSQPISGGPQQPVWFATWGSFAARMLMRMLEEGKSQVEVTREAYDAYNAALDEESKQLVQLSALGGADKNYYLNADQGGRLQVNAPWYSPEYHRLLTEIDWDAVKFSGHAEMTSEDKLQGAA
ncbi:NAD(P)/FAD-dependent oxidoreductase [Erythrobacter litoralis]|uniref:flavin-containing monooxygenase n=1 Tax=Erythrobacter litoralis TaxID=39960 RepID=UPI002435E335|nr:NAD(P)/FAD-dependent oxidoreductase [Erythrobacter litoralis]MDG6079873.1 NAD(P)/FAD-dependent oxidoreductase [Erythrobacter litoralis]